MSDEVKVEYKSIAIDSIVDPGLSMRTDITPEGVEDLAKSIRSVGLIEPIVVKRKGDKYEVIAGHRRLLACRMANLLFVPCKVVDVNDEMVETLKIHENLYREEVNVVDEAHFLEKAMKKLNLDVEGMAQLIGKSETYVIERLKILTFPDYLYNALKEKKIKLGIALQLNRIKDDNIRKQYTEYVIENGATEDVVKIWVKQYKIENQETPPPTLEEVQRQSEIKSEPVLMVECGLCGQKLPLRDAKTFYCHYECYKKVTS